MGVPWPGVEEPIAGFSPGLISRIGYYPDGYAAPAVLFQDSIHLASIRPAALKLAVQGDFAQSSANRPRSPTLARSRAG